MSVMNMGSLRGSRGVRRKGRPGQWKGDTPGVRFYPIQKLTAEVHSVCSKRRNSATIIFPTERRKARIMT
ncbi:hypothetical protein GE21DRAFT_1310686 [Neurospora crassa]|nr:hypothetical protein GE21DRAFT_1310686 [Neurospora crassa]